MAIASVLSITTVLLLINGATSYVRYLPFPSRAESISHLAGNDFLVSDMSQGNVYLLNSETRLLTRAVSAPPGRRGIGVHGTKDYIFSAGFLNGHFPRMFVYHLETGEEAASCEIPDGRAEALNDVFADEEFAYFTDSFRSVLYALRISSLPACEVSYILLPEATFGGGRGDKVQANGIVRYGDGLIVSNSRQATIYFVDLTRSEVYAIKPVGTIPFCDGLQLVNGVIPSLYVAQPRANMVSKWELGTKNGVVSARKVAEFAQPGEFVDPTGVGVFGNTMVVANINFSAPFWEPVSFLFTVAVVEI